jgi:NAD(P)-dependent dehydrogenase (short-subunit alcohol dehydrogenase family)
MSKIEIYPFGEQGWTPEQLESQKGKVFLITGGNAGVGFEATKLLASKGAKVIILSRNAKKVNTAIKEIKQTISDADIEFIQLDLASLESVKDAAEIINKNVEKVNALICNAAIAQIAKQTFTVDGFESQLGVNYYGNFLLSGLLFDKIKESNGRIVYVSSLGYKMGHKKIQFEDLNFDKNYHPNNVYSQSKLALMLFAYELQKRVKKENKNVQIQVCHPGSSKSTLIRDDASFMTKVIYKIISPFFQSAEHGAWPEVLCATEEGLEDETFYGATKRAEMIGAIGKSTLLPIALDRKIATKLWSISEEKTKFKWSL